MQQSRPSRVETVPIEIPSAGDLPAALVDRPQWLCWRRQRRDGKPTKIPLHPRTGRIASATDPDTWACFGDAREAVERIAAHGLGFAFSANDPLVGIDLDDCRDPVNERIEPWARSIVNQLESYTEVSPSGTGVHVILAGELPEGRNRSGDVECYDADRYFTVTGEHLDGTPTSVKPRDEVLAAFHEERLADEGPQEHLGGAPADGTTSIDTAGHQLSDDVLLSRARHAKNSRKFTRLWAGVTEGYDSHSEADMALCSLLAFWTACDPVQMDRLFRRSGLYRPKWDEVHYADGSTYGDKTIERAILGTDETYQLPANEFSLAEIISRPTSSGLPSGEAEGRRGSRGDDTNN